MASVDGETWLVDTRRMAPMTCDDGETAVVLLLTETGPEWLVNDRIPRRYWSTVAKHATRDHGADAVRRGHTAVRCVLSACPLGALWLGPLLAPEPAGAYLDGVAVAG